MFYERKVLNDSRWCTIMNDYHCLGIETMWKTNQINNGYL